MKKWLITMLCGAIMATSAAASPKVDAALAECDARVAAVRAEFARKDREFQREVLERMEPLALSGEVDASNYAHLFDRVAHSYNDPTKRTLQRYGTQGQCTAPGAWAPYPVEDPDKLAERRRSVGLEPEADYQKIMGSFCHESLEESLRKAAEAAKAGH